MTKSVGVDFLNVDFDRLTGEVIMGWQAVEQSVNEALRTDFGRRVMREYYGSLVPRALGRSMNEETIIGLTASIAAVLDAFEPRFAVSQTYPAKATRLGGLSIEIEGQYRPLALYGDGSSFGLRRVGFSLSGNV